MRWKGAIIGVLYRGVGWDGCSGNFGNSVGWGRVMNPTSRKLILEGIRRRTMSEGASS